MKKIFLAVTGILIVGLFVGCASKPKTPTSQKKDDIYTLNETEQKQQFQQYWHGEDTIITMDMYREMTKYYYDVDCFEKKSDRKSFTGRIINNSDKMTDFLITVKSDYLENSFAPYLIKLKVKPYDSECFTIRDISETMILAILPGECEFLVFDSRNIGRPSFENGKISKERFDYILKTHSLEYIYNGSDETKNIYSFIEPFDYEENFDKSKYDIRKN